MSSVKFPFIYWTNADRSFTAKTVSGLPATAVGHNLDSCIQQLKKYLSNPEIYRENSYRYQPDFVEFEIHKMKIPIRPKYLNEQGDSFPAESPFQVAVQYLTATDVHQYQVCVFPLVDETIKLPAGVDSKDLATQHFKSMAGDCRPEQIVHLLNPGEFSGGNFFVKEPTDVFSKWELDTDELKQVAKPVWVRKRGQNQESALLRDREVDRIFEFIRSGQGNLMVVGPSGVGKSCILQTAVRKMNAAISDGEEFSLVHNGEEAAKRNLLLWKTDGNRLIAGMQYLGEWQKRVEAVINELSTFGGILCFSDLESLVRQGGEDASQSIASFLTPFLESGEVRVILETTKDQLDSCRQILPRFDSLFTKLTIDQFDRESALRLLSEKASQIDAANKIRTDSSAGAQCLQLFRRFMPYSVFPGKCYEFWKRQFSEISTENLDELSTERIYRSFINLTGLPEEIIRDDKMIDRDSVETWFAQRIIGQEQVCRYVADTITVFKAGMNDPAKPIHVMLFAGPTGVGKTETAKAINRFLFGSEVVLDEAKQQTDGEAVDHNGKKVVRELRNKLVRLDMSEYSGIGAADRFLMDASGNPSSWIQSIRTRPFQVVLLDEIEKASPEVFDLLMTVFDEGRLTDRWGRTTDFRSTIVVMTSNLGVKKSDPVGFENQENTGFEKEVRKFFRPEFFNRIDKLLSFSHLTSSDIEKITELELLEVSRREGLKQRNLKVLWDKNVVRFLARNGYDRKLGARPLQRVIENCVVAPISKFIAQNPTLQNGTIRLSEHGISECEIEYLAHQNESLKNSTD